MSDVKNLCKREKCQNPSPKTTELCRSCATKARQLKKKTQWKQNTFDPGDTQ